MFVLLLCLFAFVLFVALSGEDPNLRRKHETEFYVSTGSGVTWKTVAGHGDVTPGSQFSTTGIALVARTDTEPELRSLPRSINPLVHECGTNCFDVGDISNIRAAIDQNHPDLERPRGDMFNDAKYRGFLSGWAREVADANPDVNFSTMEEFYDRDTE